jgi:glycosyltransferase involved in cell wall biosynthesis
MRVLITCDFFPPDIHGGTEIIVYNVTKTLIKNGYEVTVFCRGNPEITSYEGIRTVRKNYKKWCLVNLLAFPTVFKLGKKVDIIHNFTFDTSLVSCIVSKILGKPSIMSIMGVYGDAWIEMRKSYIKGKIRKFFEKLQLKLPYKKLLFLSEQSRKLGIKLGASKEKSEVFVPGIDYKKFKPSKKEPYVLFVGRIVPQKGVDYLISAAKRLPDVKFKIVGEGSERKKLERISPKNVEFLGFIPYDSRKLYNLYSKALVFCLPSIGEGLGIVLLEAMASGCAIVSTIPFDYSGFTVQPRNVEHLVEKIKYLFENKKIAIKMGKENRERVKKYRWDKILEIYDEVVKKR